MASMLRIFCGWALLTALAGCSGARPILGDLTQKPIRGESFWNAHFQTNDWRTIPLALRISESPSSLLEYVGQLNSLEGFPSDTRPAQMDSEMAGAIEATLRMLPVPIQKRLQKKLLGIFVVNNLGSSGLTESVFNSQQGLVGGFIILDSAVLAQGANRWCSWRENTPFTPSPGILLQCQVADSTHDSRALAIQMILIHEFGHVLSIGENYHPDWDQNPTQELSLTHYPFMQLGWRQENQKTITRWENAYPSRRDIHFYSKKPALPLDKSASIYQELESTGLISLYGSQTVFEDFAESFLYFIHCELNNNPYRISILKDGKLLYQYQLDWSSPRLQAKRDWFRENFLIESAE